jgi:hypothetical protein
MNVNLLILSAALMALTAFLPALLSPRYFRHHLHVMSVGLRSISLRDFVRCELGTVTVTYLYPVGTVSTTIAPGQTVMAQHNMLIAQVFMDTSDTTATVTHNWNFSTLGTVPGGQYSTLFNLPKVTVTLNNQGSAVGNNPTVSAYNANTIGFTKANLANTSCTFTVYIERPYTPTL